MDNILALHNDLASRTYKHGFYHAFKINDPKPRDIHKASVSANNTKTCWVLKCDIKKFFANIDHQVLKGILWKYIEEEDILWLLGQVIDSFCAGGQNGVGLPLGNVTSQLLINVYMNQFDQFMKRELKVKYYIRYCDDFVVLHRNKSYLNSFIPKICVQGINADQMDQNIPI